jgi:LysM repeat protein
MAVRIVGSWVASLSLLGLVACGGSPPPPPAPEPDPVVVELEPEPEAPEPDFTLAERLREPFAVRSLGRVPPRMPRTVIVVEPGAAPAPVVASDDAPRPDATAERGAESPRPTPPAARPQAPVRAAAPTTHTVAAGETFLAVARRYGLTYSQLLSANPGLDPDRIRPGQTLRLPAAPTAAPTARPQRRTHTVVQGETLWGIARRYGVSPERIRAANQLQDDQVRIGQTLVIPDPS